jgi:arginyl-tRNA synthetase
MRTKIQQLILNALEKLQIQPSEQELTKLKIEYPDYTHGDYSSNVALIMAKQAKTNPKQLAEKIIENLDQKDFESVTVAGPGFINFRIKTAQLLQPTTYNLQPKPKGKALVEYFQPNIAKPLHIGHMRTAVIGDAIKRMLLYTGAQAESDTHMGDWGTQFGYLILIKKKFGEVSEQRYAELNKDESMRELAKQEFVKLEQNDKENREIWKNLVEESVKKFMAFAQAFGLSEFEHHWPESFYEDKMSEVVKKLKSKKLLKSSQGAQIVDLEKQNLGVAIILKSDGGTTYLLRDLATFIYAKQQDFSQHLYVVDNRQSLHYKQLFATLQLMGEIPNEHEGVHVNYGFISFKGEVLSTRKGNMVLVDDLLAQAQEKVAKIIQEKNPDLKNKDKAIKTVALGALKYFDLKHNRHSDIEFNWDEVLDFEGDSGPYIQYAYTRLASIIRKAEGHVTRNMYHVTPTATERQILFRVSIFNEIVADSVREYLPNILANYLYNLATLSNKFYHESPVLQETDEGLKAFRLSLVQSAKETIFQGLDLLGISVLEEM